MAKQTINLGASPTGAGGDTPRSAFTKTQANFDELYSVLGGAASAAAARSGLGLKKAALADIVGTVSQSGGVPTGDIFERGTSAAGKYIKFADGTAIVWTSLTLNNLPLTTSFAASVYLPANPQGPIAFPLTFVDIPTTILTLRANNTLVSHHIGSTEATTTAGPTFWPSTYFSVTTNVTIHQFAIGRWY